MCYWITRLVSAGGTHTHAPDKRHMMHEYINQRNSTIHLTSVSLTHVRPNNTPFLGTCMQKVHRDLQKLKK